MTGDIQTLLIHEWKNALTQRNLDSYITVARWIIQSIYFYSHHSLPCFNAGLVFKKWIFIGHLIEPLHVGSAYHKIMCTVAQQKGKGAYS